MNLLKHIRLSRIHLIKDFKCNHSQERKVDRTTNNREIACYQEIFSQFNFTHHITYLWLIRKMTSSCISSKRDSKTRSELQQWNKIKYFRVTWKMWQFHRTWRALKLSKTWMIQFKSTILRLWKVCRRRLSRISLLKRNISKCWTHRWMKKKLKLR